MPRLALLDYLVSPSAPLKSSLVNEDRVCVSGNGSENEPNRYELNIETATYIVFSAPTDTVQLHVAGDEQMVNGIQRLAVFKVE